MAVSHTPHKSGKAMKMFKHKIDHLGVASRPVRMLREETEISNKAIFKVTLSSDLQLLTAPGCWHYVKVANWTYFSFNIQKQQMAAL
jgi:hypothetical protein